MSEFQGYLTNSKFAHSYNGLESGDIENTTKGFVYVEDESDITFWEEFISKIHPNRYRFLPASRDGKNTPGKGVLKKMYNNANENIIIAVDSDYEYILSNILEDYLFVTNPYVIHTFGYSKESVQIEKDELQKFFNRSKLLVSHNIDIASFLYELSAVSYEGLIKYLYLHTSNQFDSNSHYNFNSCFKILDKNLVDSKNISINLKNIEIIETNLNAFFANFILPQEDLELIRNNLKKIGVNDKTAYRFISGHILLDLINAIYNCMLNELKSDEIVRIKESYEGKEIGNRISQLNKTFKENFSMGTYLNCYPVNMNDEIHNKILASIYAF